MEVWREMVFGRTKKERSMWANGKITKPMVMVFMSPKKVNIKVNILRLRPFSSIHQARICHLTI